MNVQCHADVKAEHRATISAEYGGVNIDTDVNGACARPEHDVSGGYYRGDDVSGG